MKKYSIFQIYFDEESKKHLSDAFIPYLNLEKTSYFENKVILDVHKKDLLTEYIGITSWRMQQKTGWNGGALIKEIEDRNKIEGNKESTNAKDVFIYSHSFCPDGHNSTVFIPGSESIIEVDFWKMIKHDETDLLKATEMLNNADILPFNLFEKPWTYCYCNYWVAKKEIFNHYVETVLAPAIAFFERPEVKTITKKMAHIYKNEFLYPVETFILEGLFGTYLSHNNYNIESIESKRDFGDCYWNNRKENKWYAKIGGQIHNLKVRADGSMTIKEEKEVCAKECVEECLSS